MCLCQEIMCASVRPLETPPSGPSEPKTNGQVRRVMNSAVLLLSDAPCSKAAQPGTRAEGALAVKFWGTGVCGHPPIHSLKGGLASHLFEQMG